MRTKFIGKITLRLSAGSGWTLESNIGSLDLPPKLNEDMIALRDSLLEVGVADKRPSGATYFKIRFRMAQSNSKKYALSADYYCPSYAPAKYKKYGLELYGRLMEDLNKGSV